MRSVRVILNVTGDHITAEVGSLGFARLASAGAAFHSETGGVLKIGAERVTLTIADRPVKAK